jgi:hypothetical protein
MAVARENGRAARRRDPEMVFDSFLTLIFLVRAASRPWLRSRCVHHQISTVYFRKRSGSNAFKFLQSLRAIRLLRVLGHIDAFKRIIKVRPQAARPPFEPRTTPLRADPVLRPARWRHCLRSSGA